MLKLLRIKLWRIAVRLGDYWIAVQSRFQSHCALLRFGHCSSQMLVFHVLTRRRGAFANERNSFGELRNV
jgi:hypothetical protein